MTKGTAMADETVGAGGNRARGDGASGGSTGRTSASPSRHGRTASPVEPADWERLSALADGELAAPEATELRERLAREPTLAGALAAIEGARHDVRAWAGAPGAAEHGIEPGHAPTGRARASRPEPGRGSIARRRPRRRPGGRAGGRAGYALGGALAGALAASLAALLVLPDAPVPPRPGNTVTVAGGGSGPAGNAVERSDGARASTPFDGASAFAWHRALEGEATDATPPRGGVALASLRGARAPLDLSADGLTLTRDVAIVRPRPVDAPDDARRAADDAFLDEASPLGRAAIPSSAAWLALRHYRGPNGCAVTHLVAASGGLPSADAAPLHRSWRVGHHAHALVADGMDAARFAALADYAEALSRRAGDDGDLLVAHARSPDTPPCAA